MPRFIVNGAMKLMKGNENNQIRLKRYAILKENHDCPRYECVPEKSSQKQPNFVYKTCSYGGKTLKTFDDMIVTGNLCHHSLAEIPSENILVECEYAFVASFMYNPLFF